jgi:hypothetical protein
MLRLPLMSGHLTVFLLDNAWDVMLRFAILKLKGLSREINFKNVDTNLQN